jgi:hypothetical protein
MTVYVSYGAQRCALIVLGDHIGCVHVGPGHWRFAQSDVQNCWAIVGPLYRTRAEVLRATLHSNAPRGLRRGAAEQPES